jgi:hypothetical protein
MDRDENLYFENFHKLSLDEIRKMFENLKHYGLSDEQIEKYSIEYKTFFENLRAAEKKS